MNSVEQNYQMLAKSTKSSWVLNSQPVVWKRGWWSKYASLAPFDANGGLFDQIDAQIQKHGLIPRSFVHDLVIQGLDEQFLGAMIWGAGTGDGRVPVKVANLFNNKAHLQSSLQAIHSAFRSGNLSGAFDLLLTGGNHLPGIGTSYVTKVLYFMGYFMQDLPLRPLILDKRVHQSLSQIRNAPVLKKNLYRNTGKEYVSYCEWAEIEALKYGTEPVVIEYALFA